MAPMDPFWGPPSLRTTVLDQFVYVECSQSHDLLCEQHNWPIIASVGESCF